MAKATLTLQDGTVVALDSTDEGIAKILSLYGASLDQPAAKKDTPSKTSKKTPKKTTKKTPAAGLKARMEDLIEDGFFDDPKQPPDVEAALATQAFKATHKAIGTQLARFAKSKVLARVKDKDNGRWAYYKK